MLQSRKTLRKFSKVFFLVFRRLVLATCLSRENRVFWANLVSFFKPFQFSLEHFWLFIFFLFWKTLKLTVSLSKELPFWIISFLNLQENGIGFLSLTTYFMFWALFSWICDSLLSFVLSVVSSIGWVHVCCVWVFGLDWSCLG